jgi:Integrase core domain
LDAGFGRRSLLAFFQFPFPGRGDWFEHDGRAAKSQFWLFSPSHPPQRDQPTSYRSPWQNGYAERLIGSVRRECTDHLIAFNAEQLRRILVKYATYYLL